MASAVSAPVFFQPVKHPTDQAVNLLNANIKTAFDAVGLLLAEYVKTKELLVANFNPSPSDLLATGTAAAGSGFTLTLPAVTGKRHYITAIHFVRSSTAVLAGTAVLDITSTNMPSAPTWSVGNAMAAGDTKIDVSLSFPSPVKCSAVGAATTFVFPAPGAAVKWRANVNYYTGA
ncbi:MAG: hypothetical protein ABJA82_05345 [Myxococcales bacterium]